MIESKKLIKHYGDMGYGSFEVEEDEIFEFSGPGGAGKSTVISMTCEILRLIGEQ